MPDVFSVPVFLLIFRETLEASIIVSVLLAFLKQSLGGPESDRKVYKFMVKQVWIGALLGLFICLVISAAIIGTFYTVGTNTWEANEAIYEGAFCMVATVIITAMGAALLRVGKMREKWRVKLAAAIEAPLIKGKGRVRRFLEKYAMFVLPFVTVLREGVEAIIFLAGVSFSAPATAVPLPVIVGLIVGILVGYIIYKSGTTAKLQLFLVLSTCLLYLIAAALFSKGIWYFEKHRWNRFTGGDAEELGNGPGSYDVDRSVWHVNCCRTNGWAFFRAIFGWTHSATYGSVIGYNVYWIFVIAMFITMRYREVKGHWPFLKAKDAQSPSNGESESQHSGSHTKTTVAEKTVEA